MARGGKRENAGRKPGVPNTKTQEQVKAIEESGLTPLEYMLRVLRDEGQELGVRLDAANKAAPYVHAKLSNIEMRAEVTNRYEEMSDEELEAHVQEMIRETGVGSGT